jgi:hypothetical protein
MVAGSKRDSLAEMVGFAPTPLVESKNVQHFDLLPIRQIG